VRRAGLIAAVSATVLALPFAGDAEASHGGLCGIVPPIDQILHCDDARPPAPAQPAPAAQAQTQPAAAPAPRAALPATQALAVPPGAHYVANLLIVRFRPGIRARQRAAALAGAGASVDHPIPELGVVVVTMAPAHREQALAQLLRSPAVAGVERDAIVQALATTPNDPNWVDQWGLRRVGLPTAWDRTHGSKITVAVLDSGVDADQPDLKGSVLPGVDLTGSPVGTRDLYGHGTSAAGVVAAHANNHLGGAGVCWGCSVLPIKVLDDQGRGSMDVLAQGIVDAADMGARVISMSLGGPVDSDLLDQAIDYATAKNAVLVAAAGNNGSTVPFYPAANPNVIGVAATDEADRLYPWSNSGSWVRIVAPGCNPAPRPGDGFALFCGTSSAAPVVSGLVALVLSLRTDARRDQIVTALTTEADPLGAVPQGMADANASLAAVAPGTPLKPARPNVSTTAVRGALTPRRPWQTYEQLLGAGSATATLTFPKRAWLTLSLITSANRVLASVSGHSPLRLTRRPGAGAYWYGVAAAKRVSARFRLAVVARP
jgi:subtilisin family serine protease